MRDRPRPPGSQNHARPGGAGAISTHRHHRGARSTTADQVIERRALPSWRRSRLLLRPNAALVERLSLGGTSIYVAQSCQRLRGQHRSHGANPHSGSQLGGCRCHHGSSLHSRQAKSNGSSSLFPSKLRPGGSQGQEEALRPPRWRQLFVSASDHSFRIFPRLKKCQLFGRKTLGGNPGRVFRST